MVAVGLGPTPLKNRTFPQSRRNSPDTIVERSGTMHRF